MNVRLSLPSSAWQTQGRAPAAPDKWDTETGHGRPCYFPCGARAGVTPSPLHPEQTIEWERRDPQMRTLDAYCYRTVGRYCGHLRSREEQRDRMIESEQEKAWFMDRRKGIIRMKKDGKRGSYNNRGQDGHTCFCCHQVHKVHACLLCCGNMTSSVATLYFFNGPGSAASSSSRLPSRAITKTEKLNEFAEPPPPDCLPEGGLL